MTAGWPTQYPGILETVTTTEEPSGRWNVAALGVAGTDGHRVARTWGRTRTRRNLERTGEAVVNLVLDPVVFAKAALTETSRSDPTLPEADAWIEVDADRIGTGREDGTSWADWRLSPRTSTIRNRRVPTPTRGFGAVVELTIAVSRLDVASYDREELEDRISYFAAVARRCGGPRERAAVDLVIEKTEADPS